MIFFKLNNILAKHNVDMEREKKTFSPFFKEIQFNSILYWHWSTLYRNVMLAIQYIHKHVHEIITKYQIVENFEHQNSLWYIDMFVL